MPTEYTITLPRNLFVRFAAAVQTELHTDDDAFWTDGPGDAFNVDKSGAVHIRSVLASGERASDKEVTVRFPANEAVFVAAAFDVASEEQEFLPSRAQTTDAQYHQIKSALSHIGA